MVRWNLKACPRCGSDMFIDRDYDNWYKQCLMCSYRIEIKHKPEKKPVAVGDFYSEDKAALDEE